VPVCKRLQPELPVHATLAALGREIQRDRAGRLFAVAGDRRAPQPFASAPAREFPLRIVEQFALAAGVVRNRFGGGAAPVSGMFRDGAGSEERGEGARPGASGGKARGDVTYHAGAEVFEAKNAMKYATRNGKAGRVHRWSSKLAKP